MTWYDWSLPRVFIVTDNACMNCGAGMKVRIETTEEDSEREVVVRCPQCHAMHIAALLVQISLVEEKK